MKIRLIVFVIILAFIAGIPSAWSKESDDGEFLYGFLAGSYEVVGRWPDSSETYTGRMEIENRGDHLRGTRTINGKKSEFTGNLVDSLVEGKKILHVRFKKSGHTYEAAYLIHSDLDNYGRLTGLVYLVDGSTKAAGLEALFCDHGQLRR